MSYPFLVCCLGTCVVAYFDQIYLTIRHVDCKWTLPLNAKSQRCDECRKYRYVLRSGLRNLNSFQSDHNKCATDSHTNFRYLDTPEKFERMRNLHKLVRSQQKRITQLQHTLDRYIQTDGVKVDDVTNKSLYTIMTKNSSAILSADEHFKSIFWQQQMKASLAKGKQGIQWHPAIFSRCLYLHHRSSGAYSTLRNSGVIALPSERTLRDYRHFACSTPGFLKDVDLQLLDLIKAQKPANVANYVSVIIDEMYIKEGLVFDKHSGSLTGFTDLGDVCNLLAEYEQQQNGDGSMNFRRPVAKCMVVFMVRGLFTSLKFAYAQFPSTNTKGCDLFVLLWKVIERLTRLGLNVLAVSCDGAKSNRKMFKLHGSEKDFTYSTENCYCTIFNKLYFFCDPPHVLKTMRNCLA